VGDSELEERVEAEEAAARAAVTGRLLFILAVAVGITIALAFLEPSNDPRITLMVQGAVAAFVALGAWLHRRGHARAAAWVVSGTFWIVVCVSTWFFGGLEYELAASYIVSVMVAGATLGARPALGFATASMVASTLVLLAHRRGFLPEPVEPPSVVNAWISITISLILTSYLLHVSLLALHEAVTRAFRLALEKDQVRDRFLQAQKMEPVGRLAGGVAHDFNNLLSVIGGVASLLREEVSGARGAETLLDDLDDAATRMAQMTGQLLAFSRARAPTEEVLDLGGALRNLAPLLSRLMGDDVRVVLEAPPEVFALRADRARLEQVFLNLAVNAREAMPDGGTFTLAVRGATRDGGEWVDVTVTDSGHGMDAATLAAVFEPFFTTKPTGTGLGLATVHDVVEGFGGVVRVQSTPGVGTTFHIELPRASAEDLLASPVPLPAIGPAEGRVLLVEDHELVRRTTRRALETAGYEVTAVLDGAEALALMESGASFDVIVSDVMMPRLTGVELARRLGAEGDRTPIVLMSGNVTDLPVSLASMSSGVRFLAKPFSHTELLATVAEVLRPSGVPAMPSSG